LLFTQGSLHGLRAIAVSAFPAVVLPKKGIIVTAGLLRRGAEVLICRRRGDQDHPGKWEFPGGKLEPGEDPVAALTRELHEELGIEARIGVEITRYSYRYPGREPIELVFFDVPDHAGEIDGRQFDEIRWAPVASLPQFDFLDGDVDFVKKLAAGALG
jgi:8-oxo-dGTP diphosphatase